MDQTSVATESKPKAGRNVRKLIFRWLEDVGNYLRELKVNRSEANGI
jgi:hypothetical protein